MKTLLRGLALVLGGAMVAVVTSGCIVVPERGGYYDHPHYWQR